MRSVAPFLLIAALISLASGCAGYRLGSASGLTADAQSIEIIPFPNQTEEPRLSAALATALRRQIQNNGTFKLETRGKGDLQITGNIAQYLRVGRTFQPGDVITPRDFELRMTAQVKVFNRRAGKTLLQRPVTGRTLIRAFNDLASAERQALPLLANDLARKIIDLLVDGDW